MPGAGDKLETYKEQVSVSYDLHSVRVDKEKHRFIHLLLQPIFTEYLLCAKNYPSHQFLTMSKTEVPALISLQSSMGRWRQEYILIF